MRKLMMLVATLAMMVMLTASPVMAGDWDDDDWGDEVNFSLDYECEIEDIDWDGDGFGDDFGFVVEYECELDD